MLVHVARRLTGSILLLALGILTFKTTLLAIVEIDDDSTISHSARRTTGPALTKATLHFPSDELPEAAASPNLQPEQPRNLRLVFLGDSLTRYQYLSLAYFLRHGQWFDPDISVHNLVDAHSFHHPLHPDDDWNEFFLQSNRMLYPMEVCDCLRSRNGEILVERRYFYDSVNNNMAVYINMNGNKTNPGRGYYGRLKPQNIFGPNFKNLVGLPFGMSMNMTDVGNSSSSIQWEYATWGEVIRHHVGALNLNFNMTYANIAAETTRRQPSNSYVILNAGLHPHDFQNPIAAQDVRDALEDINLPGTWKTTTYAKDYVLKYQKSRKQAEWNGTDDASFTRMNKSAAVAMQSSHVTESDISMCHALGRCFNLSWTARLKPSLYFDDLHFLEPVYRIVNEDFLHQLGQLPPGYVKLNRATVTLENAA
jgi:hypothetical protein